LEKKKNIAELGFVKSESTKIANQGQENTGKIRAVKFPDMDKNPKSLIEKSAAFPGLGAPFLENLEKEKSNNPLKEEEKHALDPTHPEKTPSKPPQNSAPKTAPLSIPDEKTVSERKGRNPTKPFSISEKKVAAPPAPKATKRRPLFEEYDPASVKNTVPMKFVY
jgi:hypothetical protein